MKCLLHSEQGKDVVLEAVPDNTQAILYNNAVYIRSSKCCSLDLSVNCFTKARSYLALGSTNIRSGLISKESC